MGLERLVRRVQGNRSHSWDVTNIQKRLDDLFGPLYSIMTFGATRNDQVTAYCKYHGEFEVRGQTLINNTTHPCRGCCSPDTLRRIENFEALTAEGKLKRNRARHKHNFSNLAAVAKPTKWG